MACVVAAIVSYSCLLIFQVAGLTSKLVTVSMDEVGNCLSTESGEITQLSVRSSISAILGHDNIIAAATQCGDGLWYRVAYLNMSDSTQVSIKLETDQYTSQRLWTTNKHNKLL